MSHEGQTFAFGDGEYMFRLTLSGINEIQKKCGAGIGKVWSRLARARLNFIGEDSGVPFNAHTGEAADFHIEDIVEPIRQGLLGGGMGEADGKEVKVTPLVANRLIEAYVLGRPLQEGWALAYAIVGGQVEGYDPPKKKVTESEATDTSTTQEPLPTAP